MACFALHLILLPLFFLTVSAQGASPASAAGANVTSAPAAANVTATANATKGAPIPPPAPRVSCVDLVQRCCYGYNLCGWKTRRVAASATCRLRRCGAECARLCAKRGECNASDCAGNSCVMFDGACRVDTVFRYPRFCPTLLCAPVKLVSRSGAAPSPPVIVDEKQVRVSETRSKTVTE